VLEELSEALLDFSTTLAVSPKERAELEAWLPEVIVDKESSVL
jgi:hypothetical protein